MSSRPHRIVRAPSSESDGCARGYYPNTFVDFSQVLQGQGDDDDLMVPPCSTMTDVKVQKSMDGPALVSGGELTRPFRAHQLPVDHHSISAHALLLRATMPKATQMIPAGDWQTVL